MALKSASASSGSSMRLAGELAPVFEQQGVHPEALNALQLFEEAAARQEATAELARRLLAWLFRARYDKGLVTAHFVLHIRRLHLPS